MRDRRLVGHTPSAEAERRAAEAGVDLGELRRNDPERYRMFNAEEVLRADGELAAPAAQTLAVLFPDHDIFRIDAGPTARFRVFPPASAGDLDRVEDAAARLVTAASVPHAMFRVVEDARGERREILVPMPPEAWRDGERVVGPFDREADAAAWSDEHVAPPLVGDPFVHEGAWFVDVFSGEQAGG